MAAPRPSRHHPLLLLAHGRAGGVVPPELAALVATLEARRRAPVALWLLTDPTPAPPPRLPGRPLALVPLLLLPGGHVRHDVPPLVARLRRYGPVRRWPFLGAWPGWQAALAAEVAALASAAPVAGAPPWLLHHPLEGPLPGRYLAHLARRTGARPQPAPYDAPISTLAAMVRSGPSLPLALAGCRLTDALAARPLLARPALRTALLDLLGALP